jgi:AraC family transcriptional activator FtrA
MARRLHLSRRTLQRQFVEATGQSPGEWLIRERIALAKELLEMQGARPVDEVADLAGFGSAESMRRHFRLRGLVPPAAYRRQFRLKPALAA